MHQPNKSQSPPHLRSPPSQGSNTGFLLDSKHMREPGSYFANAPLRRFGSPRRCRPAATSIADLFVRSLVIAGYCQEHSPRIRCLSTLSPKASRSHRRSLEHRGAGRGSRRLPSGSPSSLLSPIESIAAYRSRTQRIFSSSVAQRVEVYDPDDHRINQTPAHPPTRRRPADDERTNYAGCLGDEWRPSEQRQGFTSQPDGAIAPQGGPRHHGDREKPDEVDHEPKSARLRNRTDGYKSAAKKLYQDTADIYQALFQGRLSWKEAADAVAAFEPFPPQYDETKSAVELNSVLELEKHIEDKTRSNHFIFQLYRELPSPGVKHLSKRTRGALLRRFAEPPNRRSIDARRYLALVEDMLAARLSISMSLWTSAMHLAGRSPGKVTKHDLVRVIGIWNRMEHLAGHKSDSVVFTVLFDTAIKAGQYIVADRLIEEMNRRNIKFGRHGKVANIFFHGLTRDVDGISRAFDEFVESGELVDTAVMNCLMTSFLRAGDPDFAENIYLQLLETRAVTDLARQKLTSELVAYRKSAKKFGRVLQLSASLKNILPEHHRALQEALVLSPDTRTFHILLSYHAHKSGNISAFRSVLTDMENVFAVPPRGMVYLLLFQGFDYHGRHKKGWTAETLWVVWRAYLRALHESKTRMEHHSFGLPPSFVWENPLSGNTSIAGAEAQLTNESSELYSPLLTAAVGAHNTPSEYEDEYAWSEEETELSKAEIDITEELDDLNDSVDNDLKQKRPREDNDLESLEHRLENGVFLGRRMIITILRAFGTCCAPEDIMAVWARMESIWQPDRRRGLDVMAVKEELERQLDRASRRRDSGLR
ncbi:pentatricopeptide repeat protein [Aspergillus stella-maris]|uniref:pentatricopeptide repeat protein n=1 Tax=Aspergillus stella-maris TaxID=1810926 RepID=UPI003CCD8540